MNNQTKKLQRGFTLIELMIVVAIIAVLATIAIPTYKDYTIKSNVVATLSEASSYKTAVGLCYQENGGLSNCDEGSSGVPSAASRVDSITDGKITLNPSVDCDDDAATNNTFSYSPSISGGLMVWAIGDDASKCGDYL